MRKLTYYNLLPVALMVTSPYIHAGDDNQYPAYDFEPKVTFIADDIEQPSNQENAAPKAAHDPKYPAYDFEPKVIFTADDLATESKEESIPELKVVHDPRYPAAYFEPVSVFPAKDN